MSLFQARDWWVTRCGVDEEFSDGSLAIGNVDNDSEASNKIAVGSFQGLLRIYRPSQNRFSPGDLLLEHDLQRPILQLEMGRFIPNDPRNFLAILHPKNLAVFEIESVGNGAFLQIHRRFEHQFEHTAYNFVYGPFGGSFGHDHICVQAMDGRLYFFEGDSLSFYRYLEPFLIPGPLCYIPRNDCFVTYNSLATVEAYKYRVLASSSGSAERKSDADLSGGKETEEGSTSSSTAFGKMKEIQSEWSICLGEHVYDIKVARYSKSLPANQIDIVCLGERTLFCLKENGAIRSQRRFDFFPSCMCSYASPREGIKLGGVVPQTHENLIIGSHSQLLSVYRDPEIIWAARTVRTPMSLRVAEFGGLSGLIVMLSEDGHLSVSYLGTDPAVHHVSMPETSEMSLIEADRQHRTLQQQIRRLQNDSQPRHVQVLSIDTHISSTVESVVPIEMSGEFHDEMYDDEERSRRNVRSVRVRIFFTNLSQSELNDVTVNIFPPFGVRVSEDNIVLSTIPPSGSHSTGSNLRPSTPSLVEVFFVSDGSWLCTSLEAEVCALCALPGGESQTIRHSFSLPMTIAGNVVPPVKSATFKITLDTNKPALTPMHLFEDVIVNGIEDASSCVSHNVLTFQYLNQMDASLLISKNEESGRYRIQSGHFEAMWLLVSELTRRLHLAHGSTNQEKPGIIIRIEENLPLQDYFDVINSHFEIRLIIVEKYRSLEQKAAQLRTVQKRLLVRYKDKNPSSLESLEKLFSLTYSQLMLIASEIQQLERNLSKAANRLSAATALFVDLVRYRFQLTLADYAIFRDSLSSFVSENVDVGWEEMADAAMTHLLRTALARNSKESSSIPAPLSVPQDTHKLQKHIALVCERLGKGMKLSSDTASSSGPDTSVSSRERRSTRKS